MLEPDGTAYFYTSLPLNFGCNHSFLYVVFNFNATSPAFCGLCFLANLIRDEAPTRVHEYKTLAENGNPAMKVKFLKYLESAMGMVAPSDGQSLKHFRLAREQYSARPSKRSSPGTFALWMLFGSQPRMARPLLRMILGNSEDEVASQLNLSIYTVQTSVAKGVRTALRFAR